MSKLLEKIGSIGGETSAIGRTAAAVGNRLVPESEADGTCYGPYCGGWGNCCHGFAHHKRYYICYGHKACTSTICQSGVLCQSMPSR